MIYNLSKYIDRQRAQKRFDELMDERTKIELKKKQKRSLRQNNYLYLLIGFFALETGYTKIESKTIYKEQSPEIYEYEKDGHKFIRSSANLTTTEMAITIDKFRNYSSSEAGLYLPEANEQAFLDEIEREIEKNKFM